MKQNSKLRLLTTGLDFLNSAAGHLKGKPRPQVLQYAIVHLCAGTELILKERLLREHWSLVFDDVRSAKRSMFETGDFKSVTFNDAITRLINVVGIEIAPHDQNALERLRKKRNQLEHFGIIDPPQALVSVSAEALTVLTDFISAQFPTAQTTEEERKLLLELSTRLRHFKAFVETKWKQVQRKLASNSRPVVWCSTCAHESAIVLNGTRCLFCGDTQSAEDAAVDHVFGTLVGEDNADRLLDDFPQYTCTVCHLESIIDCASDVSRAYRYICFGCGKTWTDGALASCDLCKGLFEITGIRERACEACRSRK
jgi:hypothetical protein